MCVCVAQHSVYLRISCVRLYRDMTKKYCDISHIAIHKKYRDISHIAAALILGSRLYGQFARSIEQDWLEYTKVQSRTKIEHASYSRPQTLTLT